MKTVFSFRFGAQALALLLSAGLLAGCGSDDDDNPQPQNNNNNNNQPATPQPNDADAVLVALNVAIPSPVVIPGMPATITMGMGVAAFFSAPNSDAYVDAGTVKLNNSDLTKNANNTYVYQPSQTNPMGLDFGSGVNWQVGGAGNIPAFSKSVPGMPQSATITSDSVVTKANGYTLTVNPVSTGDSILYMIASDNNTYVMKTTHRSVNSVTFTAAELSGLATSSQAIMQANVYKITSDMFGGKKVYFVNQASTVKTGVKIQ